MLTKNFNLINTNKELDGKTIDILIGRYIAPKKDRKILMNFDKIYKQNELAKDYKSL